MECAAIHGVAKSWAPLSNFTFTFHFHALEKVMATHSSVLAWRIPGMEEPGGLPLEFEFFQSFICIVTLCVCVCVCLILVSYDVISHCGFDLHFPDDK